MTAQKSYDVIVLGSGLAGSITASILAKSSFRVLMIERGHHPRFAIGESLLPQASIHFWNLGERYQIPEIQYLSHLGALGQHVTPRCGLKRTLGFVYHDEGRPHDADKCNLMIPPPTPMTSEAHLFREDVDHFMVQAATKLGVAYRDDTEVTGVAIDEAGVRVSTAEGGEFEGRYVVDATGYRSLLANKLGLRTTADEVRTRSRSMFAHLEGVALYPDCLAPEERLDLSAGWHEGTLHHIFDGGWIWVIPFNNHGDADSGLCSVGLTLDLDKFPPSSLPPEEEFRAIIGKFPTVAKQFEHAKPVRPWTSTGGRLQYGSTTALGPRCCLMAHSYGFIDPLFSRGLISTAEVVGALTTSLIPALRDDNFDPARFEYVDRLLRATTTSTDKMVHGAYVCFRDYELWNAWLRVWLIGKVYGDLRMLRAWLNYQASGDIGELSKLEDDPHPGTACPSLAEVEAFITKNYEIVREVEAGSIDSAEGARQIYANFAQGQLTPPGWGWADGSVHHLDFTLDVLKQVVMWGKTAAPAEVQARVFDFDPAPLMAGPPGHS